MKKKPIGIGNDSCVGAEEKERERREREKNLPHYFLHLSDACDDRLDGVLCFSLAAVKRETTRSLARSISLAMGVTGLWPLLEPVGRRVNIETLAGKKVAIGKRKIVDVFSFSIRLSACGRLSSVLSFLLCRALCADLALL
jgi:hypothetical protein